MFYSQFILAKKGPLGTIWIAAHLERKLRKNQVADTDIGVSVGQFPFYVSFCLFTIQFCDFLLSLSLLFFPLEINIAEISLGEGCVN